jgi:hypothetical protein
VIIYKLKEDWSSFKAGEKFTASSYGNLYQLVNDDGELADGKLVLAKIQPDLLDKVGDGDYWKPKAHEHYYFIDDAGDVDVDTFCLTTNYDNNRFALGNCFKTKEDAQAMVAWLKARQRLIESGAIFMNASDADKGSAYYNVTFDKDSCELMARQVYSLDNYVADRALYFDDCESAKISIKEHKDDWLIYLGVKEKSGGNS